MNQPNQLKFNDLPTLWKTLVIMGGIFSVICVILLIVIIMMFETDIIPWYKPQEATPDELQEYESFLDNFEKSISESKEQDPESPEIIQDMNGNKLDIKLLDIEIIG